MKRIRTFIAIDPGKKIHDRLVALQQALIRDGAEAKWVEPDNLHLTLLFLGEVDYNTVPEICDAVSSAAASHQPFPMTMEHTGCFPNPRRPRVIWAGVTVGKQEIVTLHDDIENSLLPLGCYRREERAYTPHLTLGRVKGDRRHSNLENILPKHADWHGGDTTVSEVQVMSSELTPQGPIYTVLSRAKLSTKS